MPLRYLIAILTLVAVVAFPAAASATTVEDCQSQIAALRSETATVTTFTNAKDQVQLLGKLDNTSAALKVGKNADAAGKLADFRVKVQALGTAGKLSADDAGNLDAGAAAAINCIESIGA